MRIDQFISSEVIDRLVDGRLLVGVDGSILDASRAALDCYGYSRTEMLCLNIRDIRAPQGRDDVDAQMVEAARNGLRFEAEHRRSDGTQFPAEVMSFPVSIDGETALLSVVSDITERRQAEKALLESERWLTESQRVARLGHYVYDIENDHWDCSAALHDVLGITEDHRRDFEGWLKCVHPADRERMARYCKVEVFSKHLPFDIEYRIVRPIDGVERHVHGRGKLEYDDDGHVVTMFGIIQDITERKRAEDELRRKEVLLAQTEAAGHVGSWRTDLVTGTRVWSDEAARILGFDPSIHGGDVLEALCAGIYPEDRGEFDGWELAVSGAEGSRRSDFRIVRPDGEVRWVCAHGSLEVSEYGEPVAIAGILHDVTESRHAEEQRTSELEQVANCDSLTGLYNLRGFELVAGQTIAQARRSKQSIGLIFCDVDDLKSINDELGHAQGDRALVDATSILRSTLRDADVIARMGGDEFVVLTVDGGHDALHQLNQRLQEGFELFNATEDRPYRLSMSSGTAWCPPGEFCGLEALKAAADREMYASKLHRAGGNVLR